MFNLYATNSLEIKFGVMGSDFWCLIFTISVFMSLVSCLYCKFPVSSHMFYHNIWLIMSQLSFIIYHISFIIYHVWSVIYHVSFITSHILNFSHHISVIMSHTSCLIYHVSFFMSHSSYLIYHICKVHPGNLLYLLEKKN